MPDYTHDLRRSLSSEVSGALGLLVDKVPRIDVDATADVGGGGTTAVTGFQLKDQTGANVAAAVIVGFGAYADTNGAATSTGGALDTATAGTVVSGGGTAELVVLTSATGKFTATLTDALDEEVFLIPSQAIIGGVPVDATDRESVTFSA